MKQISLFEAFRQSKKSLGNDDLLKDHHYFLIAYLVKQLGIKSYTLVGPPLDSSFNAFFQILQECCDCVSFTSLTPLSAHTHDCNNSVPSAYADGDLDFKLTHIKGYDNVSSDHDFIYEHLSHIADGDLIVLEEIETTEFLKEFPRYKKCAYELYKEGSFCILYKDSRPDITKMFSNEISECHPLPQNAEPLLFSRLTQDDLYRLRLCLPAISKNLDYSNEYVSSNKQPTVFVGILVYNAENYIEQCIESVLEQTGRHELHIVIIDDHSTDKTFEHAQRCLKEIKRTNVSLLENPENMGIVDNYIQAFNLFLDSGCDFLTFVEGDDYLIHPLRMQKHIDTLTIHPECAFSYNDNLIWLEDEKRFELGHVQSRMTKFFLTAADIAEDNYIGTWSASFLRKTCVKHISEGFTREVKNSDWLSHITMAEMGDIAHIREPLTVYRIHSNGTWSSLERGESNQKLFDLLLRFNKRSHFRYEPYNEKWLRLFLGIEALSPAAKLNEKHDLLIIDDVFPEPTNKKRFAEIVSFLDHFDSINILANGLSPALASNSVYNISKIVAFKKAYPKYSDKLFSWSSYSYDGIDDFRIALFFSSSIAFESLPSLEAKGIPFMFIVDRLGSNEHERNLQVMQLERILSSPCFKKAITATSGVKPFLIKGNYCKPSSIVDISDVPEVEENESVINCVAENSKPHLLNENKRLIELVETYLNDTSPANELSVTRKDSFLSFSTHGRYSSNDVILCHLNYDDRGCFTARCRTPNLRNKRILLRFDLPKEPCKVKINSIVLSGSEISIHANNALARIGEYYYFSSNGCFWLGAHRFSTFDNILDVKGTIEFLSEDELTKLQLSTSGEARSPVARAIHKLKRLLRIY